MKKYFIQGPNVAVHKYAIQYPDNFQPGSAPKAVDGSRNADASGEMCSHTGFNGHQRSWWQVDLGQRYNITGIAIYNREDPCTVSMSYLLNKCSSCVATLYLYGKRYCKMLIWILMKYNKCFCCLSSSSSSSLSLS